MIRIPDNILAKLDVAVGNTNSICTAAVSPWQEKRIAFLTALAKKLRQSPDAQTQPDLMAAAFWLRKSNLTKIKEDTQQHSFQVGLGLSFHICPANVPVNFVYSFALAFIAGNSCVIRLPSIDAKATEVVIKALNSLLEEEDFRILKQNILMMRYARNDEVNQYWLSIADVRLIWGGDATISSMRQFPTPIRSREVVFADRYSIAVIDARRIAELTENELKRLASAFYNDIYLMDQAACSSPQLIAWLGEDITIEKAKEQLWQYVEQEAQSRYELADIQVMDKFTNLCDNIIEQAEIESVQLSLPNLLRVQLRHLSSEQQKVRGYSGTVYEVHIQNVTELALIATNKLQTISYFGIDTELFKSMIIKEQLSGVDRIVPIGQALAMHHLWDGYDIINQLSRTIDIQ